MMAAPPPAPFVGLPVVDGRYVINDTPNIQYLIKNVQWLTRKHFKLHDHQFSLGAHVKSDPLDGGPDYGKHTVQFQLRLAFHLHYFFYF